MDTSRFVLTIVLILMFGYPGFSDAEADNSRASAVGSKTVYFVLGYLDDGLYGHRNTRNSDVVETFGRQQKYWVFSHYIQALIEEQKLKTVVKHDTLSTGYRINSAELTNFIHSFYEEDPELRTWLTLRSSDIFGAPWELKLAYISGVYNRFGKLQGDTFLIQMVNSPRKAQIVVSLLEELGCTDVELNTGKNTVPVGYRITFWPSDSVYRWINRYP